MARKFMIFVNLDLEPTIVLDNVNYHREIKVPKDHCRCGGGFWDLKKDGTLTLSDESYDFGKYDKEIAQRAFEDKRISLSHELSFEELGIKRMITK